MRTLIAAGILLVSGASASGYGRSSAVQHGTDAAHAHSAASIGTGRIAHERHVLTSTRIAVHEVRMVGDGSGYRFEPANVTIGKGDSVRFVMVSGGPHNVAFDTTAMPKGAHAKLSANMPSQMADMMGPLLLDAGESYTISFAGVPAGTYPYYCVPHLPMNQRGIITVR